MQQQICECNTYMQIGLGFDMNDWERLFWKKKNKKKEKKRDL